ncbi:MAG: hypothetical protein J0I69_09270 [Altererythrobacter sp.]|nr:hypothetical protein [Altererythrobacter sp.]
MAEQSRLPTHPILVWALCALAGILVGVSGFDSASNHPTYLPPALRYIDPEFLAHDWWLNSAHHYHFVFFALVAGLAKLGILEIGLALLNIAAVAIATHACFRVIQHMRAEYPVVALSLVIALLLASSGFCTVGATFLFSASLQPSTIATTATILAIAAFLDGRLGHCGRWLALAGAFHANFLAVNTAAFGLAYGLAITQGRPWRDIMSREFMLGLVRLLWPSLVITAISAPLILSFLTESVRPDIAAEGDWIFFKFAVPFHYYPPAYLIQFPSFLALEVLGFVWTGRAITDLQTRRMALGLQIALAILIWSATALTTLVFIEPIARLFFWRLAPFALLLATLITIIGMMRLAAQTDRETNIRHDRLRLRITLCTIPVLALSGLMLDQWLPTAPFQPASVLFLAMSIVALIRYGASETTAIGRPVLIGVSCTALTFGVLAQPSPSTHYSLLYESAAQRAEQDLFRYVAKSTPRDAQFLIPPTLDLFRLQAGRAVVVDFKALPMNLSSIVEWYHRLEAISGTRKPNTPNEIALGYQTLNAARIEQLRCRYGISHAVFEQPTTFAAPGWSEVFRNRSFKVLQFTGGAPCPTRDTTPDRLAAARG